MALDFSKHKYRLKDYRVMPSKSENDFQPKIQYLRPILSECKHKIKTLKTFRSAKVMISHVSFLRRLLKDMHHTNKE